MGIDKGLLLAGFFFIGLGLVQVYSSSYIFAIETHGDGLYFFNRQVAFSLLGVCGLLATLCVPWRFLERWSFLLFFVALGGVVMTFVPGLGVKVGGAQRWIHMPLGLRFEPAELLKVSYPLILGFFVLHRDEVKKNLFTAFISALVVVTPLALLVQQPDFGSFVICALTIFSILFVFGCPWKYIFASIGLLVGSGTYLIMNSPYRMARVFAYIDPWRDPEQKGFQIIQSLLSLQAGGLWGAGLGQGQGKLFFLPEAHTDFTLAVMGEEWGFLGVAFVILLYGYIVFRGLQIAVYSQESFAKAVALGTTTIFAFSVFINVGMTLGLLPTKGLPLPFLSYGGSSLVCVCFSLGLLLAIDRHHRLLLQHPPSDSFLKNSLYSQEGALSHSKERTLPSTEQERNRWGHG